MYEFREFIAKTIASIGLAMFTVGLAHYFFKDSSELIKTGLLLGSINLWLLSMMIFPKEKGVQP